MTQECNLESLRRTLIKWDDAVMPLEGITYRAQKQQDAASKAAVAPNLPGALVDACLHTLK